MIQWIPGNYVHVPLVLKYIVHHFAWNLLYYQRSLDPEDKGFLMEEDLRKLLKGKAGISEDDIEEMIKEYNEHLKNVKANKDIR